MEKSSSGCKLKRIKAVKRNRNETKFCHLASTMYRSFQKMSAYNKKFQKNEHQEPRLKLCYTLLASVNRRRPPEAIVQD